MKKKKVLTWIIWIKGGMTILQLLQLHQQSLLNMIHMIQIITKIQLPQFTLLRLQLILDLTNNLLHWSRLFQTPIKPSALGQAFPDPRDDLPLAQRRPQRTHRPPQPYWLHARNQPQALAQIPTPPAHQQYREPTPAVPSDDEDEFEAENAFSAISSEPRSLAEALKRPDAEEWRRAAMEELQAHELNGTWKLIELPAGKKAIGSRWVFKLKHNADGSTDHYKGRLVVKGYNQ